MKKEPDLKGGLLEGSLEAKQSTAYRKEIHDMMKPKASRLTALLLCLILLFTLGACKGKADEESTEPSANVPAANVENTLPSNEESAPPETDDATAGDSITEPTQPATDVAGQRILPTRERSLVSPPYPIQKRRRRASPKQWLRSSPIITKPRIRSKQISRDTVR